MGKQWYVIHTQSGKEGAVRTGLEQYIHTEGLQDSVSRLLVPMEQVSEIRGGRKKVTSRVLFPGYVLIEMEMTEKLWHLIMGAVGVSGFLKSSGKPVPMRDGEIAAILETIEKREVEPRPKVEFEVGEGVRIIDGPFKNLSGIVEEIYPDRGKLKAGVSLFGRATPVELESWQVERE